MLNHFPFSKEFGFVLTEGRDTTYVIHGTNSIFRVLTRPKVTGQPREGNGKYTHKYMY